MGSEFEDSSMPTESEGGMQADKNKETILSTNGSSNANGDASGLLSEETKENEDACKFYACT